MSNIKDDIKIVAKFNKENRFRDCGKLNNAIDNLINSYEEHKRENGELRNKVKELERVINRGWLVYTEKLENQIADLKSLNREKILELKQNSIPKQKVKDKIEEVKLSGGGNGKDNVENLARELVIDVLEELLEEGE